jgi:uncharacterized membrane protein YphA (DoxX/SURF4 family)
MQEMALLPADSEVRRRIVVRDLKRISVVAIVGLVALRIAIGWQFLYEGLWKVDTQNTPRPWSAAGYLRNAHGPFRNSFRNMTGDFPTAEGDPDDLDWLDYKTVEHRWDSWYRRFLVHYPKLSARQKQQLEAKLNQPKYTYSGVRVAVIPETVHPQKDLGKAISLGNVVFYDKKQKRLLCRGNRPLEPKEKEALLSMAPVEDDPKPENARRNAINKRFRAAINDLYKRSSNLGFKYRLRAILRGDPEYIGHIYKYKYEGKELTQKYIGDVENYRSLLDRYETNLAKAQQAFEFDHLDKQWEKIQELHAKLVNPIKALDAELQDYGRNLLTVEQLARGPVPPAASRIAPVNRLTIWSLTGLGLLLILGFLTPVAAIAGAGMLVSFYLVWPPWPGVPEPPGTQHAFIVNKNIIEAIALLVIAAAPTGRWFGVDGLFMRGWAKIEHRLQERQAAKAAVEKNLANRAAGK